MNDDYERRMWAAMTVALAVVVLIAWGAWLAQGSGL